MRLFISVNFSLEVENQLENIINSLKGAVLKGRFTRRENLHITLVFIGETKTSTDVIEALERLKEKSFSLCLSDLGCFKSRGGLICWLGVEKTRELFSVYNILREELKLRGVKLENREYVPHITLGRDVVFKEGCNIDIISKSFKPIITKVEKVSLMKSENVNGKLKYTEIYSKSLT
ncbi:MAG: RNA 2',3'-cyclic phosphodiesterase [Solirubrobacterales bacterium]